MKSPTNQAVRRRKPQQERAIEKIELMFEATLRILENEGLEALSTNRIAELAGVSIGTLYQYFPDKGTLIAKLVEREIGKTFDLLKKVPAQSSLPKAAGAVLYAGELPGVRTAVSVMLSAFDGRLRARKLLLQALLQGGQGHILDEQVQRFGLSLLTGGIDENASTDPAMAPSALSGHGLTRIEAFVLARAVSGALRGALLQDENMLKHPEFEASLCKLIQGYLGQTVAPN